MRWGSSSTRVCAFAQHFLVKPSLTRHNASSWGLRSATFRNSVCASPLKRRSRLFTIKAMAPALLPARNARIAVIGAGPGGLCTTKMLVEAGYEPHTYEATPAVGGTWVYSPHPTNTSAIYNSLQCNIPESIMSFSDYPFPPGTESFPHHSEVLTYLRSYTKHFDIDRHIRFNSPVESLEKRDDGLWHLSTPNSAETYDAVFVCTGHYSVPNPWKVAGLHHITDRGIPVSHSQDYREPSPFAGLDVLVIGAGPSGLDLSMEVASVAKKVYLSHSRDKKIFPNTRPRNLLEIARPTRVLPDATVEMADGNIVRVDAVIACTGYVNKLPFMRGATEDGPAPIHIAPHGRTVRGLVAQCIASADPTMAVLGLPVRVIPYPLMEDQAAFALAIMEGRIDQKTLRAFEQEEAKEMKLLHGGDDRDWHMFVGKQWEYRRRLNSLSGRPLPLPSHMEMFEDSTSARSAAPLVYRKRHYDLLGDGPGEWRVTFEGKDVKGMLNTVSSPDRLQ